MTPQPEKWTNRALISWTKSFFEKKGIESPQLEAEVLLSASTGKSRLDLFLAYDDEPTESQRAAFRELVRRRIRGEPVAYLVGSKEFYSINFTVDDSVLIPRPETEQLVLETIEFFKKRGWRTGADVRRVSDAAEESDSEPQEREELGELLICDVGAGSGCVSAALAKNMPACRVVALDVSREALRVARGNIERLGLAERVELLESDLFSAIPANLPEEKRFDAIVSNPPYVSEPEYAELETTTVGFEPRVALVGGATGAELAIRLVGEAVDRLKVGGRLALELSPTTIDAVVDALKRDGRWNDVAVHKDFAGLRRFAVAFRAPN